MMKTRVFIVRHTETIGNVEKRLTGRQDYEITERGQVLIQKLTKELEKIKFDRAYSSTSRRAIKTIEPIVEKQNLKIEESDELCEMYFGIYDGWKWEDVNKIQPEIKQTQRPKRAINLFFIDSASNYSVLCFLEGRTARFE